MKTIYLASGNAHKLHELQTALDLAGLSVTVSGPDAIGCPRSETGSTFEANALLKKLIAELRLMPWMVVPG